MLRQLRYEQMVSIDRSELIHRIWEVPKSERRHELDKREKKKMESTSEIDNNSTTGLIVLAELMGHCRTYAFKGADRESWALCALLLRTLLSPREMAVNGAIQPTRDFTPIRKEPIPSSVSIRTAQSPSPL